MKKAIGVLLGMVILALGSSAHAQNAVVGGGAKVVACPMFVPYCPYGGHGVVEGNGCSQTICNPPSATGVGIQGGVSASTSAQSQGSSSGSVLVNVDIGSGLQNQIQAVAANTSSINAVVQLQGNTAGLIESDADLSAYNNLVIKDRPVITAINVHSDNSIAIDYSQPAKLFGIFPTSLSGEVDVDAQGNTTVHLPWYAIFYAKNTANVQTSVAAAVQQSGASFGAQANAGVQLQNTARVISAATAALQAQAQASVSANAGTQ
ncbi:MAG TPA: hypothetical protein VMR99_00270 [Candidatus Paceibacterota bacterium]|nr:hypothetical protein [Candidatus Paceibacterota bacterium]